MSETFVYKSPIGFLFISGDQESIQEIKFIDEKDGDILASVNIEQIKSGVVNQCINELDNYFSGESMEFSVPIIQTGTSFQQSVWQELAKIKCGQTASYLQLSKRLGNAKAIRAVGTANGRNHIAILVPCHRVIGNNGSLVGYAGGLWRKKWLLEHEAKFTNGVLSLFNN